MPTDKELTGRIIGAAINVHKELGPGFIESVYESALAVEFDLLGIKYERQKTIDVFYRNKKVGEHRLDFLVEGAVVVELKAVVNLEKIFFVVTRSYLKATGKQTGLLLNFASMPLTIKRVSPEDLNYFSNHSSVHEFLLE
ncbi:MAG TPA: GxxExxY protein [Verrucomicrobiae bacterium]|jgi:GxxExxY protein|nr:GxxExxY protein [Verrucomicrobiae bacterium]